jgi:hypothetical protein
MLQSTVMCTGVVTSTRSSCCCSPLRATQTVGHTHQRMHMLISEHQAQQQILHACKHQHSQVEQLNRLTC